MCAQPWLKGCFYPHRACDVCGKLRCMLAAWLLFMSIRHMFEADFLMHHAMWTPPWQRQAALRYSVVDSPSHDCSSYNMFMSAA